MQKLPTFPAGSLFPYQQPAIPSSWKPLEGLPLGFHHLRSIPLYYVVYEAWWLGRNSVSRHYTGKNSHAVGGVPSMLQGYIAAYAGALGYRYLGAHIMRWQEWDRSPRETWRWDPWQWYKSSQKIHFMTGAGFLAAAFSLGALKVFVDKHEYDNRIKIKDQMLAQRNKEGKDRAAATAAAVAAAAAAKTAAEEAKAARKAARKAAKAAAKAAEKEKAKAGKPQAPDA